MGYACPVCGDPQSDDEHLANHLAFTAVLGDGDHEDWLDERVPDWGSLGPVELAPKVTEYAEETEYPQVFEDTTGDRGERDGKDRHEHGYEHGRDRDPGGSGRDLGSSGLDRGGAGGSDYDAYDADADPDDVIAEAMEMTRRMRADAAGSEGDDEPSDDREGGSDESDGGATGRSDDETTDE